MRSIQDRFSRNSISLFLGDLRSYIDANKCFAILLVFLAAVILVSFVVPFLDFGRLYGTDDYTHLFHTGKMTESSSLSGFYENMGNEVSDASSGINPYNYPFGLWLFGSTVAKMTGLSSIDAAFVFTLFFVFLLIGSFYFYSGVILKEKEHKLLATLFFVSMPNMALLMLSYRPSVFILPFLFLILYIGYKDEIDWKLVPLMLFSIFIIVISHTGTFIFLLIFSISFFLLYCLVAGKFSVPFYVMIIGSFIIYVISLSWFPQIANQYEDKSSLFLTTGNFLATKFHVGIAGDLGTAFYQNLFVGQQLIYAIMFAAIIYVVAQIFLYLHEKTAEALSQKAKLFPLSLPITNISHSVTATPFWIGPVQSIFSVAGLFVLDRKGKCFLVAALACTLLPDWFQTMQGVSGDTGALREVSFLVIIIPLTAAAGLMLVLDRIRQGKNAHKKLIALSVWGLVLSSAIITPAIATTYYLPKIAGEDYVIDGMKWLGQNGNYHDSVVGYGYRPVPIYTNMTDASYSLQSGAETRTFRDLLDNIYSANDTQSPDDFQSLFGAKYIMSSNKILSNFGMTTQNLTIDSNPALDKIYSSNDFGIYEITTSPGKSVAKQYIADNVTLENIGSSLEIDSPVYRMSLDGRAPVIERIGTSQQNFLGDGYSGESIRITGTGTESPVNQFSLPDLNFTRTIDGNSVVYRTVMQEIGNASTTNLATLQVTYRFYPEMVEREYLISNDWQEPVPASQKTVYFSTDLFTPMSDFVIQNDQGREERHIYESQDSVVKNDIVQDLYVHSGNAGIYLRYDPTLPFPSSIAYRGSTLYNMSSVIVSETDQVKPGASMHIIQYLSVGDEEGARQNIEKYQGIRMMDYPGGITPVVLAGLRTPTTDLTDGGSVYDGYGVLAANDIPFTESVSIPDPGETVALPDTGTNMSGTILESTGEVVQNSSPVTLPPIELRNITSFGIRDIIGIQRTGTENYDNYDTQKQRIDAVISYAAGQSMPLAGFMPASLDYDLDTIKVITDDQIPFACALAVSPPYPGIPDTGYRNPEMAYYHGTDTGTVLLPVSFPISTTLMFEPDKESVFTSWTETIDRAAKSGEMVFFILRANDIGNPRYTDDFVNLTSHAKDEGLTFTTPDVIADHYQKLRQVEYTGTIENDEAVIRVTNNNPVAVSDVAFSVSMPVLRNGDYTVANGTIVRNTTTGDVENLVIDTDLPASESAVIAVRPAQERRNMNVQIPAMPIEGQQTLLVNDSSGAPLANADVLIDASHYQTDESGMLTVRLVRGKHTIQVQSPGYNTFEKTIEVSGRAILLSRLISSIRI